MYAVGIMSGTSLDGIDVVLCDVTGSGTDTNIQQLAFETYAIEETIKNKIRRCCANEDVGSALLCSLNFELGEVFATCVLKLCEKAKIDSSELTFIASHGQTIFHIPNAYDDFIPSTLQLGESAVIAHRCGCPVIANFRVMDMAAHGEGAPLVPFSEYVLYRSETSSIALQNIGGIGNITILPASCDVNEIYAFDTGPGNMMIDEAMQTFYHKPYDEDGKIASAGNLITTLQEELKTHSYVKKEPPKTTGREMFGAPYTKELLQRYQDHKPADIVAAFTWFTAYCIAYSVEHYVLQKDEIEEIVLGGGGAHNKTMQKMLQDQLPKIKVLTQEDKGYSSDAKEAIAFVILGNETMHHSFSNIPSATGAKEKVILGNITPAPYKGGR